MQSIPKSTTKKLGIIGGMGSRAGYNFLKKVIDYSPAHTDQEHIEIILHNNSCIPDRTRAIVHGEASPVDEISRSLRLFNGNQVDVIALACNTSYYFYDQFRKFTRAKILHPVELVREHILTEFPYVRTVGLLATTGTIRTGIFTQALAASGLRVVVPNEIDQEDIFMRSVYMENGLKSAAISPEAVELMRSLVPKMLDLGAQVIIGACSEVPIVLNCHNVPVPFIDPMDILAQKAVEYCYQTEPYYLPVN